MPLYEYECDECSHRFEHIQKFSDALVKSCPSCGGPVKKLVSSPAIQFKGSGWYITDYARKPSGEQAGAESDKSDTKKTEPAKKVEKTDSKSKLPTNEKKKSSPPRNK